MKRGRVPVPEPRLGALLGGSRLTHSTSGETRYFFDCVDLDTGARRRTPTHFFGHGVAVDPRRPTRALLTEKRGPGACEVELSTGRVLRRVPPREGCHFYGHAAFDAEGARVFVVETELRTREGVVTVRDGQSFAVLGAFPSYGANPHDCALVEEGRTLALSNGGGVLGSDQWASVTFVDLATQKLLERVPVPNARLNAGHLATLGPRQFALVSAPRDGLPEAQTRGGLCARLAGSPLREALEPAALVSELYGEWLSVCVHEAAGTLVATHPLADAATVWRWPTLEHLATLELPVARGVALTLDASRFALSYGHDGRVALLDPRTLQLEQLPAFDAPHLSGSHLFVWRRAPAA